MKCVAGLHRGLDVTLSPSETMNGKQLTGPRHRGTRPSRRNLA